MYDKRSMIDKHGTKFGKDTRQTLGKNNINIGPGQYNIGNDNRHQVGSYSFGNSKRQGIANEVIFMYNFNRILHQALEVTLKVILKTLVAGVWARERDHQLMVAKEAMM